MGNRVRVKICGITNLKDAQAAADAGAAAVGFIFYKKSPRYVSPSRAQKIIQALPPFITPVGVFVNHKEGAMKEIIRFCGLKTIQLHGDEDPALCHRLTQHNHVIKAFRVRDDFPINEIPKYQTAAHLFDAFQDSAFGGTGKQFNWHVLKGLELPRPVIISGGLTDRNVGEAINTLKPYAVDVASGVEREPGRKDEKLIRKFMEAVESYG